MKTVRSGTAHRPSKFVKYRREAKRIKKKFGRQSPQMRHFFSYRETWADRVQQDWARKAS